MHKATFSKYLLAVALFGIASFGFVAHAQQTGGGQPPEQNSGNSLSGYAWSSTVGWVSFSGSNYAVTAAANGDLSGYAWSSNVGWISFNSSDTTGCPSGTCQARLNRGTGAVTGWAKAIAGGGAQSGGWDGWIYLGQSSNVGVNVSGCAWGGYAWGGGEDLSSGVIGWLSFSGPGYGVTGTNYACVSGGGDPDLTAGTVVATEQDSGGKMLFEVPIQNIGGVDVSGGVDMRLQIAINSDDSSEFDQNIDVNNAVINLTAGNFKTGSYTWNNPPSGRHQVRACADPSNEITEENEGNNCGPVTTFQVDNPGTGGGLTVSCVGVPSQPAIGESVTWTATVQRNIGTTDYSWSGSDSLSGSSSSVSKTYGSTGVKNARIDIDAANASAFATCSVEVSLNGGGSNATADLSASPTEILVGEATTLTWSSTSASSCTGTGFNTGNATSGSVQVAPTSDATYQINCGGATDFADVEVLQPNITITADGESDSVRVPKNELINIAWTAQDIDSCDVVGPGILVSNATDDPLTGDADVTITERSTYTISCDVSSETFTESVTVNIPPDFEEF